MSGKTKYNILPQDSCQIFFIFRSIIGLWLEVGAGVEHARGGFVDRCVPISPPHRLATIEPIIRNDDARDTHLDMVGVLIVKKCQRGPGELGDRCRGSGSSGTENAVQQIYAGRRASSRMRCQSLLVRRMILRFGKLSTRARFRVRRIRFQVQAKRRNSRFNRSGQP